MTDETKRVLEYVLKDLLSTANLTTGALPKTSGYGHAEIRLEGVVEKKNILKVFKKYGVELEESQAILVNHKELLNYRV